jgi:hypothetical protein
MSSTRLRRGLGLLLGGLAVAGSFIAAHTTAHAAAPPVITSKGVTRHGTFATVNLSLNIPADVTVEITDQPMVGTAPYHHAELGSRFDRYYQGGHGTSFHVNVTGLEPNTQYWVSVMAYDPVNYTFGWAVNQSTFTTQRRFVSFDLTSLDVVDDGDPGGCGEIFGFVEGGHDVGYGARGMVSGSIPYASRCDGQRYPLSINTGPVEIRSFYIAQNPQPMPFAFDVTVVDDDTLFGTCSSNTNCGEGGLIRFTPDLGPIDGATQEAYTKPISFNAGGQGVLVRINGTQTVSYA